MLIISNVLKVIKIIGACLGPKVDESELQLRVKALQKEVKMQQETQASLKLQINQLQREKQMLNADLNRAGLRNAKHGMQ